MTRTSLTLTILILGLPIGCGDDDEQPAKRAETTERAQTTQERTLGEAPKKKRTANEDKRAASARDDAKPATERKRGRAGRSASGCAKKDDGHRGGAGKKDSRNPEKIAKDKRDAQRRNRCSEGKRLNRRNLKPGRSLGPGGAGSKQQKRCLRRGVGNTRASAQRFARCLGLTLKQLEQQLLEGCEALSKNPKAKRKAVRQCRARAREVTSRK